ncbi:hypothetical protein R6V09_11975 [Streptomyces sp. W16]|uniref:hypothetical protein n=1 Tax=Streptomyces sp. W16 TaxID=3076631 RepID=UPI00295A7649|nr:hypothetical protein [Streptomyces sp. W16]MDV9170847.1 hypothetical protein [Streptomyces sp. W16]
MATSTHVSRLRCSGGVPAPVRIAAARAALFAAAGTVLAVAGHHVVFDVSPSWGARGVLAGLLFAVALPVSGQPSLVSRQLALAVVGQALGVGWFTTTTEPAYERLSTAWPFVIAHLAMTVLLAVLLHGVRDGRTGLHRVAGELRSLCAWLWRLLFPREGVETAVAAPEVRSVRSGPARASPREPTLAHCVVRRGPPPGVLTAA